jgi:hypothetical protein
VTLPSYAVLSVVIALDIGAAVFWMAVSESLGASLALLSATVALSAASALGFHVRRQVYRRERSQRPAGRNTKDGHDGGASNAE